MRIVLFLLSLIVGFFGVILLVSAKTSIHEIQSFILFLIAAVLFSGAGIVDAITALRKGFPQPRENDLARTASPAPLAGLQNKEKN